MNTVILFGITGGYVAEEIKRIISHYGIVAICGTRVDIESSNPNFLIIEYSTRVNLNGGKGMVVFIGEVGTSCTLNVPKNFKGIVYSGDRGALEVLQRSGLDAITCGMSNKDTIILSSIGQSSASVCLQRKISTLDGNIVEPCEYPVRLKNKITDYALLAAFAILLLCGIEPKDIEY